MSTMPDRTNAPKVAPPERWWRCAQCGYMSFDPLDLCEPMQSDSEGHAELGGDRTMG